MKNILFVIKKTIVFTFCALIVQSLAAQDSIKQEHDHDHEHIHSSSELLELQKTYDNNYDSYNFFQSQNYHGVKIENYVSTAKPFCGEPLTFATGICTSSLHTGSNNCGLFKCGCDGVGACDYCSVAGANFGGVSSNTTMGCLTGNVTRPTFFYMRVLRAGPVNLEFTYEDLPAYPNEEGATKDTDFAIWGPFDDVTTAMTSTATSSAWLGGPRTCSKASPGVGVTTENWNLNFSQSDVGKVFIMIVAPAYFCPKISFKVTIEQTNRTDNASGQLDCGPFCKLESLTATPTTCSDGTHSVSGTITYSNPPTTGHLCITSPNSPDTIYINPQFGTKSTYTLNNISCASSDQEIVAWFDADLTCKLATSYTTEAYKCPVAELTHQISRNWSCKGKDFELYITFRDAERLTQYENEINLANFPVTFSYSEDGVVKTVKNYTGANPYVIKTKESHVYKLLSVSTATCIGTISSNKYIDSAVIITPPQIITPSNASACSTTGQVPIKGVIRSEFGPKYYIGYNSLSTVAPNVNDSMFNRNMPGTSCNVIVCYQNYYGCSDTAHVTITHGTLVTKMKRDNAEVCPGTTRVVVAADTIYTILTKYRFYKNNVLVQDGSSCHYVDNNYTSPSSYYCQPYRDGSCDGDFSDTLTITAVDNIAPDFVVPLDTFVYKNATCGYTLPTQTPANLTDNCDNAPSITHVDVVAGDTIIRTWTATDISGNTTSKIQKIALRDTIAPTFTVPANESVYANNTCGYDISSITSTITDAADNCTPHANLTISHRDEIEGVNVRRVWTVTDASGNYTTKSQMINIIDTISPKFDIVRPLVGVECSFTPAVMNIDSITNLWDNCISARSLNVSHVDNANAAGDTVVRTWIVTDAFGNSTIKKQIFYLNDTTPPTFVLPADKTVGMNALCVIDTATTVTGVATATDACGVKSITHADTMQGDSIVLRTWTFTDIHDNVSSGVQHIYIRKLRGSTSLLFCSNELPYTFYGHVITGAGVYNLNIPNRNGCDSIVTVTVNLKYATSSVINATICSNESYRMGYKYYYNTGTYYDTIRNHDYCDSTMILHLTVNPSYRITQNEAICQGETYNFGGQNLTVSGTYRDTLQTINGCDSIVTLNLVVNAVSHTTLNIGICNGQSYTVGTNTYTTSGTYVNTLTNSKGCDSIVTLNLTVGATATTALNEAICQGETYNFGGRIISVGGIYRDTLQTVGGCDSIVTLNLTVNPKSSQIINQNICAGQSYTVGSHIYTTSGTYVDTLTNVYGCDSVITLHLMVSTQVNTTLFDTICYGSSYTLGANVYTLTGIYRDTLVSASGCDSIVTLNLVVLPDMRTTINTSICQGQTYSVGGNTYSTTGTYTIPLSSQQGCDSTITLILNVKQRSLVSQSVQICSGGSYSIGSSTYTQGGVYHDTLTNSVGCDSIVTTILSVTPPKRSYTYDTICQGQTYTFNGNTYNASGTYIDTLANAAGCDSIATLYLKVNPTSQTTLNETICNGGFYVVGSSTFNSNGTYVVTLANKYGCDSIVTLHLTVASKIEKNITDTICQGESFVVGAHTYTASGIYKDTLTSYFGCDSIVTLNLTVGSTNAITLNETICSNQSYTVGANTYNTTGIYVVPLTNIYGCDSIVTLNLTVNQISQVTLNETICSGTSYSFGGNVYTASGTYRDTATNAVGCDSITILHLVVTPAIQVTLNETICSGTSYSFGGNVYTASGTYRDTAATAAGCDSITTLHLVVTPAIQVTLNETICSGTSYTFGGNVYTTSGTYRDTAATAAGCDSITTLHLVVTPAIQVTLNETICSGTSYTFGGNVYTTSGTYRDTTTTAAGCDSITILHLIVKNPDITPISASICDGESYTFGGHTYTTSGVYSDTLTGSAGCDSIITLTLTVNQKQRVAIYDTICITDSYTLGSSSYDSTGVYADTLVAVSGCDSIVTLHLFVEKSCNVQSITASYDSIVVTYGAAPIFLTTSASSGLPVTATFTGTSASMQVNPLGGYLIRINEVGESYIRLYQAGDIIYAEAEKIVKIIVLPATIHVYAIGDTINVGDAFPALQYYLNRNDFVNGDNESVFTQPITVNCYNDLGSQISTTNSAGTFKIVASGAAANNYIFEYTDAQLVILNTRNKFTTNAFTPNGDGINDIFGEGFELKIFDINGKCLYKGTDGWDGRYRGEIVEPAVYYYYARDNNGKEYRGSVTLLKLD